MAYNAGVGIRGAASAFQRVEVTMKNDSNAATVVGRMYPVDFADVAAEIAVADELIFSPGSTTQDCTYRITAAAASTAPAMYVVALEAVADGLEFQAVLSGLVQIQTDAIREMGEVFGSDSSGDAADVTSGDSILGFQLEETTTSALAWCLFFGPFGGLNT